MPDTNVTLSSGQRIASCREAAGLTQEALASACGITRSAIAQWETDRASPTADHLQHLAGALRCEWSDLLGAVGATVSSPQPAPGPEFKVQNLAALGYAIGFTHWHYKAQANDLAEVRAPGFFDRAYDLMATGDMVTVSARNGGAVLFVISDERARSVVMTGVC